MAFYFAFPQFKYMDEILVLVPIVLANLLIATLSVLMYRKLQQHGDTAMANFKLHPEETVKDFKILLASHGFEASVLIAVLAAGLADIPWMVDFGRQLSAIYGILFAVVFYRWYRRF